MKKEDRRIQMHYNSNLFKNRVFYSRERKEEKKEESSVEIEYLSYL